MKYFSSIMNIVLSLLIFALVYELNYATETAHKCVEIITGGTK